MMMTETEARLISVLTRIHEELRGASVALRDISDVLHAEYYQHHSDPVTGDPADEAWEMAIAEDARIEEEDKWLSQDIGPMQLKWRPAPTHDGVDG